MSYELRPYQLESVEAVNNLKEGESGIISLPTGCHAKGTKILMYDGSIKNVEEIVINDLLMGVDSTPRKVLELHTGKDQMYKILPRKGESFTVNKGHILSLKKTNQVGKNSKKKIYPSMLGGSIVNISVEEYLTKSNTFKHIHKLYRTGVEFEKANEPILDPYLLGLILGDGCTCNNQLSICTPDIEIEESIYNYAEQYELEVRKEEQVDNLSYNYHFVTHERKRCKNYSNHIRESLRSMGLLAKKSGDKFIPQEYKTSSRIHRLEILAGLLDTDGYLSTSGFEYCTKSALLKDDVLYLSRSLGLASYSSIKMVNGRVYYRIYISGDCSIIPTRIKRKQAKKREQIKDVLVTGFSVIKEDINNYYGFTVDKDNLYLMGDFTATHNSGKTIIMSAIANNTVGRVLIIVQSSELRDQTKEKLLNTNPELDVGIVQASLDQIASKVVIGTRQSLTHSKSTRLERMSEHGDFELAIFDESHVACGQIKKIIDKLNPNIKIIGLSGTPWNLEMKKVFNGIIYEKPILEMINNKYLCEPKAIYVHSDVDLSNVKTIAGEFNQRQLEDAVNTNPRNDLIVESYLKYASDRKSTIVFASGIAHARDICQTFKDNNIVCDYVDSTIEDTQRDLVISNFKSGKLPVIVNVGILTLGFDHPETSCLIVARPTKSKILYTQIIGRGLRTSEGKSNCLIIDVVDIVRKHDLMTMTDIFGVEIKDQETLTEAIEREEKNKAEKLEREELAKQKEIERLALIAEELKLFKTNMSEYFSESYYDWYKCDRDTFALSITSDLHYTIYKNLQENIFELYMVNTTNRINTKDYISEDDNLINLIEEAEKYASRKYSTFLDRKAKWKYEPATQKQLDWLKSQWWANGKVLRTKFDVHTCVKSNKISWIIKKR